MSDTEQQPIPVQESASTQPIAETPVPLVAQPETIVEPTPIEQPQTPIQSEPVSISPPISQPSPQTTQPSPKSFLIKALESIQLRKKAKLEKIMKLANEKKVITNDDVEKLLHVSDATATRYLSGLVKQNRLKRVGLPQNPRYEPVGGSNGGN
ncbi:MAG: hypothetical protein Q8Q89_05060 [bacterium]|nr:hypothetical protein [bacterium]